MIYESLTQPLLPLALEKPTPPEGRVLSGHPIQEMMSRTGSFPLSVALSLLKDHIGPSSLLLDPFCGKGTSLLAGRMLGARVAGLDVAPEAVHCSMAKQQDVDLETIRDYLRSLKTTSISIEGVPPPVRVFFTDATLSQILSIRRRVLRHAESSDASLRSAALFTIGTLLGILHGHARYSLSIRSAHAYSMSSTYVTRYAQQHSLFAPERDVKACLLAKATRLLSVPLPSPVEWDIRRGSALQLGGLFKGIKGKADVILTSPPYLRAQTYAKDNWLRLWFLGYDYKAIRHEYFETSSIAKYELVMSAVLSECSAMLRPGGLLICIAGDVTRSTSSGKSPFHTAEALSNLAMSSRMPFKLLLKQVHTVPSRVRYLHSLSRSNGHSVRPLVERLFIAEKTS